MRRLAVFATLLTLAGTTGGARLSAPPDGSWTQWGGPRRNFMVEAPALASSWPAAGPRKLWERALGEGHSSILVEGGRLYTMYRPVGWLSMVRRTQQETIAAFDAASGKTLWEHTFDAPTAGLDLQFGAGPHSTPLIVGNRLYAASSLKQIFALDKNSGKVLWSHDLMKEFGAPREGRGFAASPILYKNTIVLPVGGAGQSLMAFDVNTGAVVWKNGDYTIAPASPMLITVNGQEQMVVFGGNDVRGVNPANGATLWEHPHKTDYGLNISTPVWNSADTLLLISSAYNSGTRLLKLSQAGGKATAQEVWFQNRMRVHIGTVIRLGDFAVGSSGDFGPCPTVAIDLKTGNILWQSRDFSRATYLHADNKLILLDEDGNLGLAKPTRSGLNPIAKASILEKIAWTTPTLVGTRLYVRDRAKMMAFDLAQ
jgi:outer membrane protein assembly factor BamB